MPERTEHRLGSEGMATSFTPLTLGTYFFIMHPSFLKWEKKGNVNIKTCLTTVRDANEGLFLKVFVCLFILKYPSI